MEKLTQLEQVELLQDLRSAENLAIRLREKAMRCVDTVWDGDGPIPTEEADILVTVEPAGENGLVMTLPAMLPRRSRDDKARFLIWPMRRACRRFQSAYMESHDGEEFRLRECVLAYEHIYGKSKRRRFVDHDNLELKHCQDILEAYFLTNDSSVYCSAFQCSHREEQESTRIWVLPASEFSAWLTQHQSLWMGNDEQEKKGETLPEGSAQ